MDSERWNEIDRLLQSALDCPAAERDVFLRGACGGDERLEQEVRSLLVAYAGADSFLSTPAIDLAWKDADADIPILKQGREEYARLQ